MLPEAVTRNKQALGALRYARVRVAPPEESKAETVPLTSTSRQRVGPPAAPSMALLVYHREGAEIVPLPLGVPVVVGRDAPADVVISDRNLSRQHARFLLEKGALVVEDLGSTNGTRVRGELVQRASFRPGEPVSLGTVVVSAHAQSPLEPELQALDSHDRFCSALAQAVAEARYFDEPLCVMMIRASGGDHAEHHVSRWCQRVSALLRPIDRLALYSHDTVELLLPRLPAALAAARAQSIVELRREPALWCGLASFPESATTAERLLERCRAALQRASSSTPVAGAPSDASYTVSHGRGTGHPIVVEPAMEQLFEAVDRLSRSTIPVLIYGETGTGKEVVARAIHERGPRNGRPLLCVNCGAIPRQLVESTLFGHTKGAFTGAEAASEGVFGAADGGTVLLDEIGELPLEAQVALLRVLETGRLARVGTPAEVVVDVRVLAATHRDLEAMCDDGSFRRDLFYRLDAVTLSIPPLRERPGEIVALVEHFLDNAMQSSSSRVTGISSEAMHALQRYHWPGNLRELRNTIERAVVIARGDRIAVEDLPQRVTKSTTSAEAAVRPEDSADDPSLDLRARVRRFEAWAIIEALRAEGGNKTHAAKRLKMPFRTLMHKIKQLAIEPTDYAPPKP
jgi:DNA-binding NtrC family response regulator